jgi:hypothetical protein
MTDSVFCSSKRKVVFLGTIVAFASMVFAAPRAYAQIDGPCCEETQINERDCGSNNCKEHIKYTSCLVPFGPNSTHWRVNTLHCCLEQFTNFVDSTGISQGCTDRSTPSTDLDVAIYAGGVWVRTCAGKYVFVTQPT